MTFVPQQPIVATQDPVHFAPRRLGYRHMLAAILLLAFALRLMLLATPRAYFPDEIFQYLEPAHRLVFGHGVITWEYRYGIRSWLVPLLLSAPMALGGWLAPDSGLYLMLPKLMLVLISLIAVPATAALGRRLSPAHGLMAALVAATWVEFALFGTQALTEAIAAPLVLAGAALLYGNERKAPAAFAAAGALLALAAVLRFQYAPSIAVFVLLRCRADLTAWRWIVTGAAAVLVAAGAVDLAVGQMPFGWMIENVRQNIVEAKSHGYGVSGPGFYPAAMAAAWGLLMLPILALALVGARHFPALLGMAIANIAIHSAIAHKEYRFILLSALVIVVLAAIGSVDAVRAVQRRRPDLRLLLPVAAIVWLVVSAGIARSPNVAFRWAAITPNLEALAWLRQRPGLCGIALDGIQWTEIGGYAYLHRNVPLYIAEAPLDQFPLPPGAGGYNAILASRTAPTPIPTGYSRAMCYDGDARFPQLRVCVHVRPGGCDGSAAASELQHMLTSTDR